MMTHDSGADDTAPAYEPGDDPSLITDWPDRQRRAGVWFDVAGGHPVNPNAPTGIPCGRNGWGSYGPNPTGDALVTCELGGTRYLLMVERRDGLGWAVPGGGAEPGESGAMTAARELAEETGLAIPPDAFTCAAPIAVPDERATDEAWPETTPAMADLGPVDELPAVKGGDDAARAVWIPADDYPLLYTAVRILGGTVFGAHTGMLRRFLGGTL